ncbi:hypothetical protein TNCV_1076511 [Trichonephila clavipes]|uniref:Uncharacterized protein n=1 Tax=Trichonephila clavipes TaxID=2585209 RepID=A0A8X6RMN1_TRICX|nr:hypothetical protein TNCV_1076511 [Trichonephila clavipes]
MVRDLEHRRQKTDSAPEPTDFSWTKWSGLHALGGPTRRIHSRRTSPTPSSVTLTPRCATLFKVSDDAVSIACGAATEERFPSSLTSAPDRNNRVHETTLPLALLNPSPSLTRGRNCFVKVVSIRVQLLKFDINEKNQG